MGMKRMNALQRGIGFACIAASVTFAANTRAADLSPEHTVVRAVMKEKCFNCHGEKKQKGKLRLDTVSMTPQSATDLAVWRRVYEQIMDEEMPPEDEAQFSDAELKKTVAWLEDTLETHSDLNLTPSAGNYVDHEALFSGEPAGDPATPARVWRLAPRPTRRSCFASIMNFSSTWT